MNIHITEKAAAQLNKMLEEQGPSEKKIRIMMTGIGWSGPRFDVALDEQNNDDVNLTIGNFNFILDKRLATSISAFTIDYRDLFLTKGFKVYPDQRKFGSC